MACNYTRIVDTKSSHRDATPTTRCDMKQYIYLCTREGFAIWWKVDIVRALVCNASSLNCALTAKSKPHTRERPTGRVGEDYLNPDCICINNYLLYARYVRTYTYTLTFNIPYISIYRSNMLKYLPLFDFHLTHSLHNHIRFSYDKLVVAVAQHARRCIIALCSYGAFCAETAS